MKKEYAEYILAKTKQDYNLIGEEFSRTRRAPWEEIKFLADDYLSVGDKVLDIGCGNGRLLEFLLKITADYTGIDNSEKLIEVARKKYPAAKFQTADGLKLPFPDNYFDIIYSIAVLHHIPSKELRLRFCEEAKRVLRHGGLMILTVWKFHQLNDFARLLKYAALKLIGCSQLDFGDIWEPWGRKTERYYHWFSQNELKNLVSGAGLKIRRIGGVKNKRGNRQNYFLVAEKS
ncbi:MAG: hypothetical protein A2667_02680 [Candidatus Wildermuthbacteria bacterium RIFCSPHIGHO2_01_FULL_47_27]|uniref:Methyltransferase type 11 domain-containing protein n=2 Tax=Candidatus Wildermuthiibacteriota TaxID=1817923 RepID=A0A1G2RLP2_9BACT|nr:MAG: hypothetical protein UY15_C0002G0023 [Parcubacteria group bacterium GW2011_GWA2_47_9]OHA63633.1 MAG: hypothetical protein A2667_02680 [Candidatus Wildermuthbacteria bacterium RIFCSPHIGHO2_01_FULL_47_27]OHA68311.1 MAG: hypothetical protein A3D59_04085 [Candidatus Wildermuthbacteria bacterium RIFCSPHIGHO2_02_FULL_47_17]OHA73764.1 MAG: hypothetical protein A3A32_01425 [Candidatus Wildermuthbacteria bacterium RIFCSPLOWO2_01_FULL_48_35]OHA76011.1 MAG: hypothetical protein A3I38_03220 [Candid